MRKGLGAFGAMIFFCVIIIIVVFVFIYLDSKKVVISEEEQRLISISEGKGCDVSVERWCRFTETCIPKGDVCELVEVFVGS